MENLDHCLVVLGKALEQLPQSDFWLVSMSRFRSFLSPAFHTSRRLFSSSRINHDFHFDTHHFVQRLEREGLNRAQAEGIMTAMAEVIDESIRNMTSNMVTKAEQEKVSSATFRFVFRFRYMPTASLHSASGLCSNQVGAPAHGEK